jgi:hypothetical protein
MTSLWLDDVRPCPSHFSLLAKTAKQAIHFISSGWVSLISFDHDLGPEEAGTGYDVAKFIEKAAHEGTLNPISWEIHSANPVGRQNIEAAMLAAERYWMREKQ